MAPPPLHPRAVREPQDHAGPERETLPRAHDHARDRSGAFFPEQAGHRGEADLRARERGCEQVEAHRAEEAALPREQARDEPADRAREQGCPNRAAPAGVASPPVRRGVASAYPTATAAPIASPSNPPAIAEVLAEQSLEQEAPARPWHACADRRAARGAARDQRGRPGRAKRHLGEREAARHADRAEPTQDRAQYREHEQDAPALPVAPGPSQSALPPTAPATAPAALPPSTARAKRRRASIPELAEPQARELEAAAPHPGVAEEWDRRRVRNLPARVAQRRECERGGRRATRARGARGRRRAAAASRRRSRSSSSGARDSRTESARSNSPLARRVDALRGRRARVAPARAHRPPARPRTRTGNRGAPRCG